MRDACFWWIHFVWSTLVLRLHPNNRPQILADWASSDSNAFSVPSFQKYFPIYFVLAHYSPWTPTSDMPNAAAHFFLFFFFILQLDSWLKFQHQLWYLSTVASSNRQPFLSDCPTSPHHCHPAPSPRCPVFPIYINSPDFPSTWKSGG